MTATRGSTMKILYLFPDTNLFIQCRALNELDWSSLRESDEIDEIHLIVCRDVQREIDRQKQRGNDRVGRQARRAYSIFRDMVAGSDDYGLIKDSSPQVKLFVDPSILPSPEIGDRLDYQETDDRIVGSVYAYKKSHPDSDARLLTHDSGPMASARMLGLPCIGIPDSWIRPPERTKTERENERLQLELERIKNNGPRFEIIPLGTDGDEISSLEFNLTIYEELSDVVRSDIIDWLTRQLPLSSDFGPRESMERPTGLFGVMRTFTPASDQEIDEYKRKYSTWVKKCEDILQHIHISLNDRIRAKFCFSLNNVGTRPGKDALVTITAKGNFLIRPPLAEKIEEDARPLSFPSPPNSPQGKWSNSLGMSDQFTSLGIGPSGIGQIVSHLPETPPIGSIHQRPGSDPNQFYYKPHRSAEPSNAFSLECAQWRHGMGAEIFEGHLCITQNIEEIDGSLECIIHAENLSTPEHKIVPVKSKFRRLDTVAVARKMVDDLVSARKQQE